MISESSQPDKTMLRKKRLRADLALLLVSVIWGSAFVAQRIAAVEVGAFLFNGLRFLLGGFVLLPFAGLGLVGNIKTWKWDKRSLAGIGLAGLLILTAAAFQQGGLRYTTAANAGFITGLYVVWIPIFLVIGGQQRPRPVIWVAATLSVIGLFLLSTGGQLKFNPGDILELFGAVFWALHVILIGALVKRRDVMQVVIGQYLVCGALSLAIGLWLEADTLPALADSWWAVGYTGLFSVGLGYTLQAVGQQYAPPADAAIILSAEAVFAAGFGWVILSETLTFIQLVGCGVMLAGMLLAQSGRFPVKSPR